MHVESPILENQTEFVVLILSCYDFSSFSYLQCLWRKKVVFTLKRFSINILVILVFLSCPKTKKSFYMTCNTTWHSFCFYVFLLLTDVFLKTKKYYSLYTFRLKNGKGYVVIFIFILFVHYSHFLKKIQMRSSKKLGDTFFTRIIVSSFGMERWIHFCTLHFLITRYMDNMAYKKFKLFSESSLEIIIMIPFCIRAENTRRE